MSRTNGNIVEYSTQYIDNKGFNSDTQLKSVEIGGTDGSTVNRLKVNSDGSIVAGKSELITKIASPSTGVYYVGKAAPGSSAASAVWQIKKLDTTSIALDKTYADGVTTFTNIWNDRAGYAYS